MATASCFFSNISVYAAFHLTGADAAAVRDMVVTHGGFCPAARQPLLHIGGIADFHMLLDGGIGEVINITGHGLINPFIHARLQNILFTFPHYYSRNHQ